MKGAKDEESSPYIKDFAFYKSRFNTKHKEIKASLREFGTIVEQFQNKYS